MSPALEAEIRERFGVVPRFFAQADSPELARSLWRQARAEYLNNPMPSLLKERLFVYLSRHCEVPYCLLRHASFLLQGRPAGDPAAPVTSLAAVLRLLRTTPLSGPAFRTELTEWTSCAEGCVPWPEPETTGERLLLSCAVKVFLRDDAGGRCATALRSAFGADRFGRITMLLGFVRRAHLWTEAHPDLRLDEDLDELLREQPELDDWLNQYRTMAAEERAGFALIGGPERGSLARERARLGFIMEDSLNEIYVFDDQTLRFTLANRGARANLGYSMEELRRLTPVDLKPSFDWQTFGDLLEPLRRGDDARCVFETIHRRKDGSEYPTEVHLHHSRNTREFVALIVDLTVARETASRIASTQASADAILDAVPDAIITIDDRGTIQRVNAASERMFGYEADDLVGENVRKLMPEPHRSRHDGYLERHLRTGEARIIGKPREVEARRRDGSVLPVRLSVGKASAGDKRLYAGVVHDLSEEIELRGQLRALFQQRASLAGVCDLQGTLVDANAAALEYSGVRREDVIGRPFWETPWWSHDPALQRQLREALERAAQGEEVRFDAQHPRPAGGLGTVDFVARPVVDAAGAPEAVLVESRDMTRQHELQEQLLQAQKMEAIGALASGIAHDFNNLLTAILGSSEILSEEAAESPRIARSAERIRSAAQRAQGLTAQLLAFSRKQLTQPEVFSLNEAVRSVSELFGRLIPEHVEIKVDLDPGAGHVRCDPSQLDQVLINLAVNAADAMPSGGTLAVTTAAIEVSGAELRGTDLAPGRYARVSVQDTGSGIPPEVAARIFEPFYTTKAAGKGTGLGLSTSRGILDRNGGAIRFEARPGGGTTFHVYLATAEPAARAARPEPDLITAGRGGTILVVEDDELMRELLAEVLESDGHSVLVADRPERALELARTSEASIDLVVSDMVLPEMSGLELIKRLSAEGAAARVLFMSGYTDQVLADQGKLMPGDAFLRKPFSNRTLLTKVQEILGSE